MMNCKKLNELSDESFKNEINRMLKTPDSEISDCISNELIKRDMVIKISKNFIPFVSKVVRYGETQKLFAERFKGHKESPISKKVREKIKKMEKDLKKFEAPLFD